MGDPLDPSNLAAHGGSGGIGFVLAMLWQRVFSGKKDSNGDGGKRLNQLEKDVEVLQKLHEERNKGDEFKRGELEQLKKDRTELQTQVREFERRLNRLEDK